MYIYPPDPQLPGTNSLIPTGIAIAVFAPLVCILDLPPLIWHIRNRNTAAASLVAWIILHNLFNFINFLIWPTDDFTNRYLGEGLCDVEVKFMTARSVALPAASLCIIRQLANVMNTERTVLAPSKLQRRRGVVMDLIWCLGLPLVMMLFHYIVQPTRYLLYGVSGCAPTVWGSWLTILLMCMPPLLLSLANAYYASKHFSPQHLFHCKRSILTDLPQSSSSSASTNTARPSATYSPAATPPNPASSGSS